MNTKTILLTFLLLVAIIANGKTNIVTYPMPDGESPSQLFQVAANKQPVAVYEFKVPSSNSEIRLGDCMDAPAFFEKAAFASFDADGRVKVSVTCPDKIEKVKILPESLNITPRIKGNSIVFDVMPGQKPTIEVNGDYVHALHLFVNDIETNIPHPDDPGVVYFGPGIHYVDNLELHDNQTMYVAGGAIVMLCNTNSGIELKGNNIKVCGRGIVDGSMVPVHKRSIFHMVGTNIDFRDIILRDPCVWAMPLYNCNGVTIDNVKILGHRANSDGIDICSSENVTVENCFIRVYDDLIVIKTPNNRGPAHHIYARHNVLWSELAHALSIGAELTCDVSDVEFSDSEVIRDHGREWALRVFHCDQGNISDIRFKNLKIDECRNFASLWINEFVWSTAKERGHISNISFENIEVRNIERKKIELLGFDADHIIDGVSFKNVTIEGAPITNADIHQNEFVKNVVIE